MKKIILGAALFTSLLVVSYLTLPSSLQDRAPSSNLPSIDRSLLASKVSPKLAWDFLNSSPYDLEKLPFQKVSYRDFYQAGKDLLLEDSKRTIKSGDHFIPYQRKLLFPMGICLRGTWSIGQHNHPYTGHFRAGTKSALIARAATSLDRIYYNEYRTLALSGKIFPTTDLSDQKTLPAANFLLMNDNAGKKNEFFTEAHLTNAAPTTVTLFSVPLALIGKAVGKAFNRADKRRDMRQLYQIAELRAKAPYSSPKWMVLRGNKDFRTISHELGERDYRIEIAEIIENRGLLDLEIFISSELKNNQPVYERIGKVSFYDYVASPQCDQSLHFQHPPYLDKYGAPEIDQELYENKTLD